MYETWEFKKKAKQEDTVNSDTCRVEGALHNISAGGFGSPERLRSYE